MADLLDTLEGSGDEDDTGGGVFQQPMDNFNHEVRHDVQNPQVTRAQEQVPENLPNSPAPEPVKALVFAQDSQGNVSCAYAVNGNLVEAFRTPTPEEIALAPQARWRQTAPAPQQTPQQRQYMQQQQMPSQPQAMGMLPFGQGLPRNVGQVTVPPQPAPGGGLKKLLLGLGLIVGGGYAAVKAYRWAQDEGYISDDDPDETEEEATQRELDEADDVDEEVEV